MKFLERKEKRAAFDKIKEEKKEVLMEKKAVRKAVKLAKETGGVVCSNPTKKKDVDNDGQVMMQVDEQEVGHQHQKEVGKEGQVLDPAAILELQKKYDRLKKIKKEHKKQLKLQQVASSATTNTGITTATSSSTLYADGNVTETKDKKKKKEDTSTTTEVKVKSSSSSSKEQVSNPPKSIITPAPKSKRSRLEKEPSAASSSSKRTKRDHVSSTADFFLAQPDSGAKTTEKELVTQKSSSSITTVKKNTNEEPTSIPLVVIESLTVKALPSEVSTGHTGVVAIVDKTKKGSKKKQKLDANIKNGKEGAETTTKVAFNPLELEETGEAALTVIGGWD